MFGFSIGFLEIFKRKSSAIRENAKMTHMDQCTPIHPIKILQLQALQQMPIAMWLHSDKFLGNDQGNK